MQLFPLFEDFDRVHNGSVSRLQFRRVLSQLQLESMISHEELQLLFGQFKVKIGLTDDVNYIAFCEMVYHMAGFEWRKP
jgi:Ca2+-binding EF-hand superfamily protein